MSRTLIARFFPGLLFLLFTWIVPEQTGIPWSRAMSLSYGTLVRQPELDADRTAGRLLVSQIFMDRSIPKMP